MTIYRAFHYVEGVTRTHLLGWTGKRWRNPCGLLSSSRLKPATFTKPLCRTCDRVTAQIQPHASPAPVDDPWIREPDL